MTDYPYWQQAATANLEQARSALAAADFNTAGVRAQQACVNTARALMVALGEPAATEDSLIDVLDWLPSAYQASFEDQLRVLDNYFVPSGNPADLPPNTINAAQAAEAVDYATDTLARVARVVADL